MNRKYLQALAEERLIDAQVLLANGRFGAAWYLAGYVIECALKACIAKLTKAEDFPIKNSNTVYIHNLEKLALAAGMNVAITQLAKNDKEFETNWAFVSLWSEESRYDNDFDQQSAEWMLDAVSDPQHGALKCIKQYW